MIYQKKKKKVDYRPIMGYFYTEEWRPINGV